MSKCLLVFDSTFLAVTTLDLYERCDFFKSRYLYRRGNKVI